MLRRTFLGLISSFAALFGYKIKTTEPPTKKPLIEQELIPDPKLPVRYVVIRIIPGSSATGWNMGFLDFDTNEEILVTQARFSAVPHEMIRGVMRVIAPHQVGEILPGSNYRWVKKSVTEVEWVNQEFVALSWERCPDCGSPDRGDHNYDPRMENRGHPPTVSAPSMS